MLLEFLKKFNITSSNRKFSSPDKQLIIRRCFEYCFVRCKGQWGTYNPKKGTDALPHDYETNPISLYTSDEVPFMGVLYNEEEDYRERSLYSELLQKYISADVRETLGISFLEFMNVTNLEASMMIKVCETHKQRRIDIQNEQVKEMENMQKRAADESGLTDKDLKGD